MVKKIIGILLLSFALLITPVFAQAANHGQDKKNVKYQYFFGKNDTHAAPNEDIERQEACAMVYRIIKQNYDLRGFKPVEYKSSTWSKNAMNYMVYIGVYDSVPNLTEKITRGEIFKIVAFSFGLANVNTNDYEYYTQLLKQNKLINGYGNNLYGTNNLVTRAEFCQLCNTITNRQNRLMTIDKQKITADTYGIVDIQKGDWYYQAILMAMSNYENGYVTLDNRLSRSDVD